MEENAKPETKKKNITSIVLGFVTLLLLAGSIWYVVNQTTTVKSGVESTFHTEATPPSIPNDEAATPSPTILLMPSPRIKKSITPTFENSSASPSAKN